MTTLARRRARQLREHVPASHAQGWRSLQDEQDRLDAGESILRVLASCLAVWACVVVAVAGVVSILERIGG